MHTGETFVASSMPHSPVFIESALFKLIFGIYSRFGDQSLRILRQPVHLNREATPAERALAKITAKRIQTTLWTEQANQTELTSAILSSDTHEEHGLILSSAEARKRCVDLAASIEIQDEKYLSHRKISALALDAKGQLIAESVNANARNRLLHAEINLLSSYWARNRKLLPAGTTIITSLSPCLMCAHALIAMSEDGAGLRVLSIEEEQGKAAGHHHLANWSLF